MVRKGRTVTAALEAEELIRELGIDHLPIDPIEIAESLGIVVEPKCTEDGVSGMLIRVGNEFGIVYATHIESEGFRRFSVAHEIGHFRIPGHIDAVLEHGQIHESHAGFVAGDKYEREADEFAATLLMPSKLFVREMRSHGDGLQAVRGLAEKCVTSLPAAAIRYVQLAEVPVAMVVSTDACIDYCFMSDPMRGFDGLLWPRKGQQLPVDSETEEFNLAPQNISASERAASEVDLRVWFGGRREIPGREEVVGLGRYGKTLTILSSEIFVDDEDENHQLEERWESRF